MMLRRSLSLASYATLVATGFCAQPSAPAAGDNLNLRYANGIVAVAEDKIITVADVSREITPLLPVFSAKPSATNRNTTPRSRPFKTASSKT